MKSGKPATKPSEPRRLTRRQLSRHQRELRLQRLAVAGVGAALVLALLVPLYGYWREVVAKGDQPVAVVRGEAITTELYARFLGYQQALLEREMRRVSDRMAKAEAGSLDYQSAQLELQLLQQRARLLPDEALDQLIEGRLIREEAARRGLAADAAELDAALRRELSDYPLGGFIWKDAERPIEQLLSVEEARQELRALLGRGKLLTEEEHRTLVLETDVLRAKLQSALAESVPRSGEQVRARHILVETEEQAREVRSRLERGDDFASLARELSQDAATKDEGGELGWFPKGRMLQEFEAVAFSANVGETSEPVRTAHGYHIVRVEEKAEDRPFDDHHVQQLRVRQFAEWLTAQKTADPQSVQEMLTPDRREWASRYVVEQLQGDRR
mgnify:CR=1 FL=1